MADELFPGGVSLPDIFRCLGFKFMSLLHIPVEVELAFDDLERFGVNTGNLAGQR